MKKNVGGIDRILRITGGAALLAGGIFAPVSAPWRIGMVVVAAIALITAFTGL